MATPENPSDLKIGDSFQQCRRCKGFVLSGTSTAKRVHNVKCLTLANNLSKNVLASSQHTFQGFDVIRFPRCSLTVNKLTLAEVLKACQDLKTRPRRSCIAAREKLKKLNDSGSAELERNPKKVRSRGEDDDYTNPEEVTKTSRKRKRKPNGGTKVVYPSRKEKCELCGKILLTYSMEQHKEFHLKMELKAKNSKVLCILCNTGFSSRHNLKKHFIRAHMDNCPYVCRFSNCDFKSGDYFHLERHVSLHLGSNFYTCPDCKYKYTRYNQLVRHKCVARMKNGCKRRKGRFGRPHPLPSIRVRRVNTNETQDLDIEKDQRETFNNPSLNIKKEECINELESVHITDRIIETANGPVHIKGEQLESCPEQGDAYSMDAKPILEDNLVIKPDPDKIKSPLLPDESTDKNFAHEQILKWDSKLLSQSYINTLIQQDPVFQETEKKHPEFTKLLLQGVRNKDYTLWGRARLYRCETCTTPFRRVWALEKHKKLNECRYSFKTHKKTERSEDNPGKNTKTVIESNRKTTAPNGSSAISLLCVACGYQSTSAEDLKLHIKTSPVHRNDDWHKNKRCQCTRCGSWFETMDALHKHIDMMHLRARDHKCECGKSFTTAGRLKAHKIKACNRVSGMYPCSKCKRNFKVQENCLIHEKDCETIELKRSQNRPQCVQCGELFGNKTSLRRHVLVIHANQPAPLPCRRSLPETDVSTGIINQEPMEPNGENLESMILGF